MDSRAAWVFIALMSLAPISQATDVVGVPTNVASEIVLALKREFHRDDVTLIETSDFANRGISIHVNFSLERVDERLFKQHSVRVRYDPEGLCSNNTFWVKNGNVVHDRNMGTTYYYIDEHSSEPRLLRVYFPMNEATWVKIRKFVDAAKITITYHGKVYAVRADDIVSLSKDNEDQYRFSTKYPLGESVMINLKKKTHSVGLR
jgi:hypothetical protein